MNTGIVKEPSNITNSSEQSVNTGKKANEYATWTVGMYN